jgi:2-phosphosulfolactate phosphatase
VGIGTEFIRSLQTDETPVLIDALRASSTIITAFSCGVREIIPIEHNEQAWRLKKQGVVIAGESNGVKLPGYDLGNSPVELIKRAEQQPLKVLALKTSNLLPLLVKLRHAWICSSLNVKAMAHHLLAHDVAIIAVGSRHGVTEDLSIALALFARLSGAPFDEELLPYFIQESRAAQHLRSIGYEEDVLFISRINQYTILPYYDGKTIKRMDA